MRPPSPDLPRPASAPEHKERSKPTLLPAFEPFSSSPSLPKYKKRPFNASSPVKDGRRQEKHYPTPVPTSSTFIPTSSPPQLANTRRRAPLQRTQSAISERAPLATVPTIDLPENGEPVLLGRSSNSSHYQLSTNKLISRVHVRVVYIAASGPDDTRKVQIECTGWNGVKVHCQSRAWDLMKGDTFTSETDGADIMLDVHDARVLIPWPQVRREKAMTPTESDNSSWDGENSPSRRVAGGFSGRIGGAALTSPLRQQHRLQSPVSPSPAVQATFVAPGGQQGPPAPLPTPVQIFEDEPSDAEKEKETVQTQQTQISTQIATQSFIKSPREAEASASHDFSDNDEENDPIISSFGPFGANLGARFESFNTASPGHSPASHRRPLQQLKEESVSPQRRVVSEPALKRRKMGHHGDEVAILKPTERDFVFEQSDTGLTDAVRNHLINQLAYSALSATPLSTLVENLPAHLRSSSVDSNLTTALRADAAINSPSSPVESNEKQASELDSHTVDKTTAIDHVAQPLPPQTFRAYANGEITQAYLQSILHSTSCIGAVERSGKDAAGKRLESEYYYILEQDDDEKRKEVVTGTAGGRGLRSCRRVHKVGVSLILST